MTACFLVLCGTILTAWFPHGSATYLAQVGTRSYLNDTTASYTGSITSRSYSYNRGGAITAIQIGWANFYVDGSNVENNNGHTESVTTALEYPSGTCHQLLFSGSATGTLPDGGVLLSDALTISIPNNAKYFIWLNQTITGAELTHSATNANSGLKDTANGDAVQLSSFSLAGACPSITDAGASQAMTWPALQVAQTTLPSVLLLGDSRLAGYQDSYSDGAGYLGDVERSIGPSLGELNAGRDGTTALQFTTNYTKRSALFPYFSNLILEYGINDNLQNNSSAATVIALNQTIFGLFGSSKPAYLTTWEPVSTSTDGWATTANQTASDHSGGIIGYNADLRIGGITGMTGYFDVASAVDNTLTDGKWKAPSYTPDGLHASQTGNLAIFSAGVVDPSVIHR